MLSLSDRTKSLWSHVCGRHVSKCRWCNRANRKLICQSRVLSLLDVRCDERKGLSYPRVNMYFERTHMQSKPLLFFDAHNPSHTIAVKFQVRVLVCLPSSPHPPLVQSLSLYRRLPSCAWRLSLPCLVPGQRTLLQQSHIHVCPSEQFEAYIGVKPR